jgi:N utilization substance protein B
VASRYKLRELIFSILFQVEVGDQNPEKLIGREIIENEIPTEDRRFFRALIRGVVSEKTRIDTVIGEYAKGWKVERIARADLTILRMAIFEILFKLSGSEADPPVVINEAVRLAKKYSGPDAGKFVNGILGSVVRDMDDDTKLVSSMVNE